MTIGYILDDSLDRSDGVQQAMIAIGEHMRSLGHDVHYIVTNTTRRDIQNIHSIGSYYSLSFNGNSVRTPRPVSKKLLKQLFSDISFDVLHVQMPYSPFFAARVLNHAPKDVVRVGTFHILPYNWFAKTGTRLLGLLLRRSLKNLDVCYAVSEPALQFMRKSFSIDGSVLPNPVDYEFYHNATRSKTDRKHIVYIGRFEERKGVRELVRAYAQLDKGIRKQAQLIMISKGPLLDEIKQYSDDHSLRISFPGFVSEEEKAQYLAGANIAVFPSISGESFGIVLTEAMSAGAGITIGGNNPGYASVLSPWPDTLFDPKDTLAFSILLTRLLADPKIAKEIGTRQHEYVKQFDIGVVAERLLDEAYRSRT